MQLPGSNSAPASRIPKLLTAAQKMEDHSTEAGCSSDDLPVIPADRMHLLVT
jgi:hypothetical protein